MGCLRPNRIFSSAPPFIFFSFFSFSVSLSFFLSCRSSLLATGSTLSSTTPSSLFSACQSWFAYWLPFMSAPTSTPSQSPLTASVVKFRCLYTHDLRRKSKRWQDGYLRYHAFNKRVMVYDDHGNYIGDHHWRSPDEVQDGDELELDKGVLIEVGERMGTTQQDLTNLFEKRKSSQTSPSSNNLQARPTPTPTPALAPASTPTYTPMTASTPSTPARPPGSQSFRSLNDLLGIKRTPVGHRPSPYEERHPQTSSLPDSSERAPKRPRVAARTTPAQSRTVQPEVVDLTDTEPQPPAKPPSPPTPREKTRPLKDVIPNRPAPVEEPQLNPKEASPIAQQARQDPPTFKKPALPRPPEIRIRPKPIPTSPEEAPAEVQTARVNPTNAQDTPDNDRLRNPRNSRPNSNPGAEVPAQPIKMLRMATEKPRRKLMYSALLPSDPSQRSSPSSAMGPPEKRSQSAPKLKESQSVRARK